MKYNLRKLLMHCCCAPCFTYIENDIKLNGILNEEGKKKKLILQLVFIILIFIQELSMKEGKMLLSNFAK